MSEAIKLALIPAIFGILTLIVNGIIAARVAKAAKDVAETKTAVDNVVHSVDGHLTDALDKMLKAMQENANARGQLEGRDYTRSHMEEREDLKIAKHQDEQEGAKL